MSITKTNIQLLRRALDDYATIPAELAEVDALAAAASVNLAAVDAEQPPGFEGLKVKNLRARTEALALWTLHDEQRRAAARIAQHVESTQAEAWFAATHAMFEAFRPAFTIAAEEFTAAYRDLEGHVDTAHAVRADRASAHRQMTSAGAVLSDLSRIRDTLTEVTGLRPKLANDRHDHPTRIACFPDVDTLARKFLGSSIPRASVDWFARVLALGGEIRWNTPQEQEAHVAGLPRESTAYTAGDVYV